MFSGHLVTKEWSFLKMCYTFLFFNNYSKFTDLFCDSNIYLKKKRFILLLQGKDGIFINERKYLLFKRTLAMEKHLQNVCLEMFLSLYDFVIEHNVSQPQNLGSSVL